jgi:diguanylate cyclase (GGDEF)-like protein
VAIHEDFRKILTKSSAINGDLGELESALFGVEKPVSPKVVFEVDCALQGEESLEMVLQAQSDNRPYALAFVDGRMPPGWDGIETISHLWRETPELQVVLCTAYADYSWKEIRHVLGEGDGLLILKKPFDNMEVLQLAYTLTRKWELSREVQGRLNQLAFYDNLTGLPNRALFLDRLAQTLTQARRYQQKTALFFIDMDNFKRINDTLGHSIGDELLRATAQRLNKSLRASDTVARPSERGLAARLGGDEFTVVLPMLDKMEDAATIAKRIAEQLSEPIHISGHQVTITPCIGVAIFPQDGGTVDELLKNADTAMYFAKSLGPNTFQFYHPSMNAGTLNRLNMENHLRKAIEKNEFSLHYQPQFDLETGQLSGMEALLRWHNSELGDVAPLDFIPVAEESGLILSIGEWVLREACKQAVAWIEQGLPLQRMAVNISIRQLAQPDFAERVRNILDETGLPPDRLEIEITENLLDRGPAGFVTTLDALKKMEIHIAVDDFGTGYLKMTRLKEMSIDRLKIDRSFICGIDGGPVNKSIISAVLAMAQGMNVGVIAEGVETSMQVDFLRGVKCQEVQGFLFSRPLTLMQAEAFLQGDFFPTNGGKKIADANGCLEEVPSSADVSETK